MPSVVASTPAPPLFAPAILVATTPTNGMNLSSTTTTTTNNTTPLIDSTTKERAHALAAEAALLLGKSPMGLSPIAKWLTSNQRNGGLAPRKLTDRLEDLESRIYRKGIELSKNAADETLQEDLRELSEERSKLLEVYWTQYMSVPNNNNADSQQPQQPLVRSASAPSLRPPQTPNGVSASTMTNTTGMTIADIKASHNREKSRREMASPATGLAAEALTLISRGTESSSNDSSGHLNDEDDAHMHRSSPNKRRKRKLPGDNLAHVNGTNLQQPHRPELLPYQHQQQQQLRAMPPPPPPPLTSNSASLPLSFTAPVHAPGIRCQCKKSRCLKLYCDCFAARKLCVPNECRCVSCENYSETGAERLIAIRYVLSKRSDGFQEAAVMTRSNSLGSSQSGSDSGTSAAFGPTPPAEAAFGTGPVTLSTVRGCFCRKSQCLKKYCVCFNARVQCGSWCRCLDCANGRPHDPAVDAQIQLEQQQQQQMRSTSESGAKGKASMRDYEDDDDL